MINRKELKKKAKKVLKPQDFLISLCQVDTQNN